jgi:hypothetical protein
MFLKISAPADPYIDCRRSRGQLSRHNTPLARKTIKLLFFLRIRKKLLKISKNHYLLSTSLNQIFVTETFRVPCGRYERIQ